MPSHLLDKVDRLAGVVSCQIIGMAQCICKFGMIIIFLQIVDPLLCDISDGINISEYCHRVAVAAEGIYGKRRIDQCI